MKLKRWASATAAVVLTVTAGAAYEFHSAKATHAAVEWKPVTDERLMGAAKEDGWLMYLRSYKQDGHAPFTQINTSNVDSLKVAFTHAVSIPNGFEAPPIVNGRTMIVTTPLDHVYALDATNGTKLWEYDYKVDPKQLRTVCCDVVNRGVALYGDNVYMATLDNHVVALDGKTGAVKWNHEIYPKPGVGFFMTTAPIVVKGLVIAGDGGGEYGGRGFVFALDSQTGAEKWRSYTVPSPSQPGGKTWPKGLYKHGGGNAWMPAAYDSETDTLLYGVGNPGPWLSSQRPGKNLYTDSIIGVSPETGKIKWYFQETPNDPWDYDAVNTPAIADVTIKGVPRKVFYQAGRNGVFYVVDRTNGKLVYEVPFTKATSVTGYDKATETSIVNKANIPTVGHQVFTCPAFFGGDNWWSYSYDPQTGYAYVPTMRTCMTIEGLKPADFVAGLGYLNEKFEVRKVPGAYGWGALQAIDVATGKQMWTKETKMPWNDGTLSTDGGLVFSGTPDQKFYAFDAKSGKILWTQHMSSGVIGQPMTYMVDGVQYVAVQSGWGGVSPLWGGPKMAPIFKNIPLGGNLYVFKLPSATKS